MSSDPPRARRPRLLAGLAGVAALGWVAASGSIHLARWFWPGELMAGFAWQLGWCGLVLAAALALLRFRGVALALTLASALHLVPTLRLYLPVEPPPHGRPLTLATANLLWVNRALPPLERWLRGTGADVVVLAELSHEHLALLDAVADRWPHQLLSPPRESFNPDSWGTAVLSRRPFRSTRLIEIPPEGPAAGHRAAGAPPSAQGGWIRPAMEARLEHEGRELVVRGAHPMRPGPPELLAARDRVLRALESQDWSGAAILAGDLNLPPASPLFRELLSATGLSDSRAGFGRQPSFVAGLPLPGRIRSPRPGLSVVLDHVLLSDELVCLRRATSVVPGSDHLGVVVELALRRDARQLEQAGEAPGAAPQ